MCLTLTYLELAAQSKSKAGTWSEYQGKMKWEAAKAKCASNGMRLPSIEDFKAAYATKATEPWKNDASFYYWSSTPSGSENAYFFDIGNGSKGDNHRNQGYDVRCIR